MTGGQKGAKGAKATRRKRVLVTVYFTTQKPLCSLSIKSY